MPSQIDFFKLWEKGYSLADAAWYFGPRELAVEYNELCASPIEGRELTEQDQRLIESSGTTGVGAAMALLSVVGKAAMPLVQRQGALARIRDSQRQLLLENLSGKKFLALGYTLPRDATDLPCPVLLDAFDPKFVDWQESSIEGNGLHYVAVRVIRRTPAAKKALTPPTDGAAPSATDKGNLVSDTSSKRRPGRPSVKSLIIEAYQALSHKGEIHELNPMTVIHAKIAAWIEAKYPATKPPEYEAVRRTIKPVHEKKRG